MTPRRDVLILDVEDTIDEVREVYLPLSRLLSLYAGATRRIGADTSAFLHETDSTTPFVVGVAGSVAVGKSTIARDVLLANVPMVLRKEIYALAALAGARARTGLDQAASSAASRHAAKLSPVSLCFFSSS